MKALVASWATFLAIFIAFTASAAEPGLIDDFDGNQAALLTGTYSTFGENNLGQAASVETSGQARSGSQSRLLQHTVAGGSSWGMGTRKTFHQVANVQDRTALELWVYTTSTDDTRSFDLALVFDNGTIYSLKPDFEPKLSQANGQWLQLTVPLAVENFDPSWNVTNFDLTALAGLEFFIKNNDQGPADLEVYFDDVTFVGAATVAVPQNLMSFIGDDEVGLTWDPSDSADGYKVYRRTDDQETPQPGDLLATIDDPAAHTFYDTSAADGVVYRYWLTAFAGSTESDFSTSIVAGANFGEYDGTNDRTLLHDLENILSSRANALIASLYHGATGAQASYLTPAGAEPGVLSEYGRVWVYDAGIALSLAVNQGGGSPGARASWLQAEALDVPGMDLFAGWPFSLNQERLGDNWKDPRNVTGANAWALHGLAEAIASGGGGDSAFFSRALDGILHHVQSNGLVTAGWTIRALQNASAYPEMTYNEQLSFLGGVHSMDDVNDLIDGLRNDDLLGDLTEMEERLLAYAEYLTASDLEKVQSLNVVLEHNIDLLDLLNFTLEHYGSLSPSRSHAELNTIRLELRDAIFSLLYNQDGRHFITGMSDQGVPSEHVAIDNSTWLASALDLEELAADPEKVAMLSDSLDFTVRSFVRRFFINGKFYYGAHYFLNNFEDAYILNEGQSQNEIYHIEATCGLILGLMDFADAFPDDPNAGHFSAVALDLWKDMQRYIHDLGFLYGSQSIQDLFEPLESTVSAVWYLDTLRYFRANPERYDENPPVITLDPATQDLRVPLGGAYSEPTVTCIDDVGGVLPVSIEGAVDTSTRGFYTPIYSCEDGNGNRASTPRRAIRVEVYVDPPPGSTDVTAPAIVFTPFADATSVLQGDAVAYPQVSCYDESDDQPLISEEPAVDTDQIGLHLRRYYCQDISGNTTSKDFVVLVYGHRRGFWIEDIHGNITGDRLWSENAQTIMDYVSQYESGARTCTLIVEDIVAQNGLGSPDDYYFQCESIQSRRSGELMAAICPDGIFSDCPLTKDYGQFISVSGNSLSVNIDRGVLWWRFWTGVGATVQANDAVCLDPYQYGSETSCFSGGTPNSHAIYPVIEHVPSPGSSASDFDLLSVPKIFEYYTWYYTHNERCRDVNDDLCRVDREDPDQSRPGYTPVLFPPDFSLSAAQANAGFEDAIDMGNKDCWLNFSAGDPWPANEDCYAGRQRSGPDNVYIDGVRFFDEYAGLPDSQKDWEWGFYTDNKHQPMLSIYDGSNYGFSSDYGVNPCQINTGTEELNLWVEEGIGEPDHIAANFVPDYFCSFTEDQYKDLLETKLSLEEQEREAIAQAFFDSFFGVATTVVTGGLGSASGAAKSVAASARLARILKAVEFVDQALELATIAAEVYVFATEQVLECRSQEGADRTACFFQATAPSLIGLAGDRFIDAAAGGRLLDTLTRKVPAPGNLLDVEVPGAISNGLRALDFEVEILNSRRRAEIEAGTIAEHHVFWQGESEIAPLLATLPSSEAIELNLALWAAYQSGDLRSMDRFREELSQGLIDVQDGVLDAQSLIDFVNNWIRLIEVFDSVPALKQKVIDLFNQDESLSLTEMSTELSALADGFPTIAGELSTTDIQALEGLSQASLGLFVELVINPDGVPWTNQTPREFLDSVKEPDAVGGVCYVG